MAELTLYLTENDELPIVALAMEMGCRLIPDLNYPVPQYDSVTTIESYRLYRDRTRLFLLVSDRFYLSPLEMRSIKKDGKTIYYLSQRSGGPTIQFLGGGVFEEHGSKFVRPGDIGYHSTYQSTTSSTIEKPPPELVDTYKGLQKLIRRSFSHSKPAKVSLWVGPEAVDAVKHGAKLVGFEKYTADQLFH